MLPLEGVRILTVEQYGAGPFGTMFLADQGAEVIKIENPTDGGDMARAVGPHFFAPGDSEFFHSFNRNKRSLTLDLGRDEGLAVSHEAHLADQGLVEDGVDLVTLVTGLLGRPDDGRALGANKFGHSFSLTKPLALWPNSPPALNF